MAKSGRKTNLNYRIVIDAKAMNEVYRVRIACHLLLNHACDDPMGAEPVS